MNGSMLGRRQGGAMATGPRRCEVGCGAGGGGERGRGGAAGGG